jgi:hypothetical protein
VDEEQDPASIEHFGIATVEVMSSGVIPIGLAKGGTLSIVSHGESGFLAQNKDEIVGYTVKLMHANADELQTLQDAARKRAATFSFQRFDKLFDMLLARGAGSLPFKAFVQEKSVTVRNTPLWLPETSSKIAVIFEPSLKMEFEYVVRTTMMKLGPEWSLAVFHTKSNAGLIEHMLKNIRNARFFSVDMDFSDVRGYNRLLKSPWFWKLLQAEHALIFQSDSVVVGTGVDEFLEYDYVGAPWHRENEIWSSPHANFIRASDGVGNGGLSLRRVSAMIALSEEFATDSPDEENEDIFFVLSLLKKGYKIAPRDVAYRFAQEVPCTDLPPVDPFALHAAWYYNPKAMAYLREASP